VLIPPGQRHRPAPPAAGTAGTQPAAPLPLQDDPEALPGNPEPFTLVLIGRRPWPPPPPAGRVGELVEILASADPLPLPLPLPRPLQDDPEP